MDYNIFKSPLRHFIKAKINGGAVLLFVAAAAMMIDVFSKKHLTNMQFRAAILLSTLSKMALVVRSVSRHKNYKEDYL